MVAALVAALLALPAPRIDYSLPEPVIFEVAQAAVVENPPKPTAAEISAYATSTAKKYGLNLALFSTVISCESKWNTEAIGDNGTSFGIAQFHNPETEWGFTREQANDPYFALDAMGKAWADGFAYKWSCWHFPKTKNPL